MAELVYNEKEISDWFPLWSITDCYDGQFVDEFQFTVGNKHCFVKWKSFHLSVWRIISVKYSQNVTGEIKINA